MRDVATHQYSGFTSHLTALKRSFSNHKFSVISNNFFAIWCNTSSREHALRTVLSIVYKQRPSKQMLLAEYLNRDQLPPGSPPLHLVLSFIRNKNEGITSVWTKRNCKDLQKRKMASSFLMVLCFYLRDSQVLLVCFLRHISMALCTQTLGLACSLSLKQTVAKFYLACLLPFSFNLMQPISFTTFCQPWQVIVLKGRFPFTKFPFTIFRQLNI